jgi:hypothetical protein
MPGVLPVGPCGSAVSGVLKVRQGGRNATFEAIARVSNKDAQGVERADVHASTVRLKVRSRHR